MVSIVTDKKPDVLIIGGGIVGLWSAWVAARRGLDVRLVEKRTLASGASGGMLGALMPHHPGGWSEKKQFQLNGLLTLPDLISELERETSLSCGYGRVGRVQPIGHPEKRRQSHAWVEGAQTHWPSHTDWTIRNDHPAPDWASCDAPSGWNTDTLSARVNPRAMVSALAKWVRTHPDIDVREGECVTNLPDAQPTILSAGTGTFQLLDPQNPKRIGKGVKGQGALLKPSKPVDPNGPIIYDNGIYVIAHADGTIAVGSTSENAFTDAETTDDKLEAVIDASRSICAPLRDADVLERWAGVRPKAGKPDPLLGPLPDRQNIIIATGGFKITFAIAHIMAEKAVAMACGQTAEVPELFLPSQRFQPLQSSVSG
ncbi:MAG: FAD-dependent oxidoreductase [Pseudomonadota bacterium]